MTFFCWLPFSWDISIFFIATTFHMYDIKYFQLHIQRLSNGRSVTIPTLSYFFIIPFMFGSNLPTEISFLFLYHTFNFVEQFSLNYLFLLNVTWICHWETGSQDSYMLSCLCMNWITDVQSPITKKEVTWFDSDQDAHLLFTQWFVNWRASSKVCTCS